MEGTTWHGGVSSGHSSPAPRADYRSALSTPWWLRWSRNSMQTYHVLQQLATVRSESIIFSVIESIWINGIQYDKFNGVYTILVSTFNPEVWNLKPILSKYLQIKWFWMVKFCKVPKNRDILFLPAVWQERLPGKIRSDHMWLLIVAWWPWWFDVSSCAARPFWL